MAEGRKEKLVERAQVFDDVDPNEDFFQVGRAVYGFMA